MPAVSVIIVSYKVRYYIEQCLNSVLRSVPDAQILVVDNKSDDGTVEYLRERFPESDIISNDYNAGFGKANNIGIQYAIKQGYDAVLLLNEDAWLDENALEHLASVSSKHPEYGIVSPIHLTGNGDKPEKGFATYTGIHDLQHLPDAEIVEAPFIDAAIWLIRTEVLKKTGLFAPIFYHYGEDKDLANRMTYYHYKIGYLPNVFGYHDREFRQVTRVHFIRGERVYHLSEYTNIIYSFGKAFCMGVLALSKKILLSLVKGKWKNAATYTGLGFGLLMKTPEVIKARKISKHVDLNNYAS